MITKICELCGSVFEVNDKNKRQNNRRFCSSICAKTYNGKANLGRKMSEEFKLKCSERSTGENNPFFGKKHTEETRIKISTANKGKLIKEKHPNWKGGIKHRKDGYLRNTEGEYIHRLVMEEHLGRKLEEYEIIHHINGDTSDNRIENLELTTQSEHSKFHYYSSRIKDSKGRFTKRSTNG